MAISAAEFSERRRTLLSQCEPNSLCIVAANSLVTRSNDTEYPFRQSSDFWYLTGFNEPEAYLLLSNKGSSDKQADISYMFVQPTDAFAEVWHGRRLGVEAAKKALHVSHALDVEEIDEYLADIIDGHQHLYYSFDDRPAVESTISLALAECRNAPKQTKLAPSNIHDIQPLIHGMRLIKSDAEISVMQEAANISCQAHRRAMQFSAPGKFEYHLEAELHHEFAMNGARYPAYGTIVGSGDNACILHYTENCSELHDGDLVLIDAGCELHGYAADITRTFPVNGKFNDTQKKLYQLVLDSQKAALDVLIPGKTISEAMQVCVRVIVDGLLELGILSGTLESNIENETWRAFFMHGLGHWLGLDVHDVGIYKFNGEDRPLEAGMVMTVEPGLYIPESADVEQRFKGIGIRIEDNIVLTEAGHRNLTKNAPKEIDDIEALMAK
jgi:Xaa-Pro aminopeptidase